MKILDGAILPLIFLGLWMTAVLYVYGRNLLYKWCPPYRRWRGTRLLNKLDALRKKHQHWEACRFADRSFQVNWIAHTQGNAGFGLKWAASALLAHDPSALTLAEEVIKSGHYVAIAQETAGQAFFNAGDMFEAEQRFAAARALLAAADDKKGVARVLMRTANLCAADGRFQEAQALCNTIAELDKDAATQVLFVESFIEICQGHYATASDILSKALAGHMNTLLKMQQAHALVSLAALELHLGNFDAARCHLRDAQAQAPKDEAGQIFIDAVTASLLAAQDRADEAHAKLEQTEKSLAAYVAKRCKGGTMGTVWPPRPGRQSPPVYDAFRDYAVFAARVPAQSFYRAAGIATYDLGEYERCLQYWNRLLSVKPSRVGTITAFRYIGECHRALGNHAAAAQAYREAVNIGIETHDAQLAHERLRELDATETTV